MDPILAQMQAVNWTYADKDPAALAELRKRLEDAGRRTKLLRYSELAQGVVFHLPQIRGGTSYEITTWDWSGLDRRIIGEFLGYLSMESWQETQLMVSALVVSGIEYQPSEIFFEWMKQLGVLPNLREETVLAFWSDQVKKAFAYYRSR
jgi:hypothetical protein